MPPAWATSAGLSDLVSDLDIDLDLDLDLKSDPNYDLEIDLDLHLSLDLDIKLDVTPRPIHLADQPGHLPEVWPGCLPHDPVQLHLQRRQRLRLHLHRRHLRQHQQAL